MCGFATGSCLREDRYSLPTRAALRDPVGIDPTKPEIYDLLTPGIKPIEPQNSWSSTSAQLTYRNQFIHMAPYPM